MAKSVPIARFAVGEPGGLRSSSWGVYRGKKSNDVYLSARSLAQTWKISLHASGENRAAFTLQFFESTGDQLSPHRPRWQDCWQRPSEGPVFKIVFPYGGLSNLTEWPNEEGLTWIPAPGPGRATVVSAWYTPAEPSTWPDRQYGAEFLGRGDLGEETLCLVHLNVDVTDHVRDLLTERKARASALPERPHLRQLYFGKEHGGSRFCIELDPRWRTL